MENCTSNPSSYLRIYNPGQNVWNNIEKFSESGHEKKGLVSILACFLTAIAKV